MKSILKINMREIEMMCLRERKKKYMRKKIKKKGEEKQTKHGVGCLPSSFIYLCFFWHYYVVNERCNFLKKNIKK